MNTGNSERAYRERFRTQLKTARMTSENTSITVEDAPATFKYFFGSILGTLIWFCTYYCLHLKKREIFNLIYLTLTFINFSFSFNFMHVKSYNKTFQNACATRLNKSLLVQSYILSLQFSKNLVSSRELSVSSHPFAHNIVYT